jgi:hypothetical protein
VLGGGNQSEKDVGNRRVPGQGTALVGALRDVSEQDQNRVRDAAQDGDDESGSRVGLNPRMIVFGESGIEDLVRGLDAQ